LGLGIAKDMGIKILNIKGDSDLVILQVKKIQKRNLGYYGIL
jgi:hypothetical protein